MTELEKAVAYALRLSDASATKLLVEIQRNIDTARAELIRSGISAEVVNDSSNKLVDDAIITFCLIRMGDEEKVTRLQTAFEYQQDNLRKS